MDSEQGDTRPRVVVGMDGSPASRRALRFAADEARRRGADLQVLTSFAVPDIMWPGPGPDLTPQQPRMEMAQQAARKVVDSELPDQTGLHIDVVATTIAPTIALVERSAGADLLVLGSRGHGGFLGLLMGSVSMQCVLHARCPVTVVRAAYDTGAPVTAQVRRGHGIDDARRQAGATFL